MKKLKKAKLTNLKYSPLRRKGARMLIFLGSSGISGAKDAARGCNPLLPHKHMKKLFLFLSVKLNFTLNFSKNIAKINIIKPLPNTLVFLGVFAVHEMFRLKPTLISLTAKLNFGERQ
jgi:hypothetical protein